MISKIIDRFEENGQEKIKRTKDFFWADFEQYFDQEDQIRILLFLVSVLILGLTSLLFFKSYLTTFLFLLCLVFDCLVFYSIRNFIKRDKRIKGIQKDIYRLKREC